MRSFDISNDRLGVLHGLTQNDVPSSPLTQHPKTSNPSITVPHLTGSNGGGEGSHATTAGDNGDTGKRSKSKFRFKKKHRSDSGKSDRRHNSHHHHHHHYDSSSRPSKRRRHTHHREVKDDPSTYDDTYLPNASTFKYADSDEAFRQSLFDAMADEEGAAFWEGVYGQPINVYPRPEMADGRGELEVMDDNEYAAYVRKKMWEKSHQHIAEERERRGQEKENKRKERDQNDRTQWEQAKEIQRGEDKQRRERKARNRLRKRWDEYLEDWARIVGGTRIDPDDNGGKGNRLEKFIPWPVESGKLSDLSQDAVERFFLSAPASTGSTRDFFDMLKLERVRWHPDKAQQRWGKGGLGNEEMKGITSVFQAIDSLWIEYRIKKNKGG